MDMVSKNRFLDLIIFCILPFYLMKYGIPIYFINGNEKIFSDQEPRANLGDQNEDNIFYTIVEPSKAKISL